MYDPTYDPVEHLDKLKVRLVRHTLRDHSAIWVPERQMVLLDRGLREDFITPVLAHECVHAEHSDPGGHHRSNEARANLISAQRLINPIEWRAATRATADYDRICLEVGITRDQFLAFHDYQLHKAASHARIERIGDAVYVAPKMGAGQWRMRVRTV